MSDCGATNFIQNNEAFLLTLLASISGMLGLLLNTCIKADVVLLNFVD